MLYEADVIEAVCKELEQKGYIIDQKLDAKRQGYDIVALKGKRKLIVEAKGATSSLKSSNRYGKPFDRAQVRVHVSEALYKIAEILSIRNSSYEIYTAIALPKNKNHEDHIEKIQNALDMLRVAVFFVDDFQRVEFNSPWEL